METKKSHKKSKSLTTKQPANFSALTDREKKLLETISSYPNGMEDVFERVSNGESLERIATSLRSSRYVLTSLIHSQPEWRARLQFARRMAADKLAEEVVEIADLAQPGEERLASTKIEARKWTASMYDPERFGRNNSAVNINIQELHLSAIQALEKSLRRLNEKTQQG